MIKTEMKRILLFLTLLLVISGVSYAETYTDNLTASSMGLATSYGNPTSYTGGNAPGITYTRYAMKNGTNIQINNKNGYGIWVSGNTKNLVVKTVTVNISGDASVNICASDNLYTQVSTGTPIETATSTNNKFDFSGRGYKALSFYATKGVTYISSIEVVWETSEDLGPDTEKNEYVLVTKTEDLYDGAHCIIVNTSAKKALSTTQNNNNRGATGVDINNYSIVPDSDVAIIRLDKVSSGYYTLSVTNGGTTGYLYAAGSGSSSNYLRTRSDDTNGDSKADISISANGNASIKFTGSNTNNDLRYNSSSSLFSCYGATNNQQVVQIYIKKSQETPDIDIDENLPEVGSNFKQVLYSSELSEDYYVIARVTDVNDDTKNYAMSTVIDDKNIKTTHEFSAEDVSTGASNFKVITTHDEDVLIVKLEKNDKDEWGIKTANYGAGKVAQGYFSGNEDSNNLIVTDTFTPANISINSSGNVIIDFQTNNEYKIGLASNNSYFNYQKSPQVIQLYKLTEAQLYDPNFDDLTLRVGDRYTIELDENSPEVTFRVMGNNIKCVTLEEGNVLVANEPGSTNEATIEATWEESEKWFGGLVTFKVTVLPPLADPGLSFRYGEVRGKLNVGVVSQAVYYVGDGKVEYSSSDPSVAEVNSQTGMIRTNDIHKVGTTTITAKVDDTEEFLGGKASYTVIIEEPEYGEPGSGEVTFDFVNNGYGMFDKFNSDTTTGKDSYQDYYEQNINEKESSHVPVYEFKEDNVTIKMSEGAKYRWWSATSGRELRIHNIDTNTPSTFTIECENGTITSVVFDNTPALKYTGNEGNFSNGTFKSSSGEGVKSVTFSSTGTSKINTIKVVINSVFGGNKEEAGLAFECENEGETRIINTFVGVTEKLPILSHKVPFEDIDFDIDEINIKDSEENDNYAIELGSELEDELNEEQLYLTVYTPGVYTFRADYKGSEEYYKGMAILRVNVFPHLEVLPKDSNKLADDERTNSPALTLAHVDEGKNYSTIKIPAVENDPKYSTVSVRVTVKHGEDEEEYYPDETGFIPEIYTFEKDGYIEYTLLYADTEDFSITEKSHVVIVPEIPYSEEGRSEGEYIISPFENSTLEYITFVIEDPENVKLPEIPNKKPARRIASADPANDGEWQSTNNPISIVSPDYLEEGQAYGVYCRSTKDISTIMNENNIEGENTVSSPYTLYVLKDNTLTDVDGIEAEEGEAEYFTLQGVKVSNPEKGIYIKVVGGKAVKVVR